MAQTEIVYVTYIATTAEKLWEALTDGEFTRRYWGGRRIQSDWKVGSPVRHVREDGGVDWQGEVLQSERPHRFSYTFHMEISDQHRRDQPSRVTFELQPMGSVVKLTLIHDDFESEKPTFETTRHGWPAIMSSLKSLLETGNPLPFQGLGLWAVQQSAQSTLISEAGISNDWRKFFLEVINHEQGQCSLHC